MRKAFRLHAELRSKMAQVSYLRKRKLACQRHPFGTQRCFGDKCVFRMGVHLC